jgi:hypothetical protein
MKKHLFLSVVIGILTCRANSAISKNYINSLNIYTSQQDTIKFLQDNIISHKEKFQHKELNIMLKELHLDVKSYLYRISKPGGPIKYITLFFEEAKLKSRKLHQRVTTPFLVIYFENEIPRNKTSELWDKSRGEWLEAKKIFMVNSL